MSKALVKSTKLLIQYIPLPSYRVIVSVNFTNARVVNYSLRNRVVIGMKFVLFLTILPGFDTIFFIILYFIKTRTEKSRVVIIWLQPFPLFEEGYDFD